MRAGGEVLPIEPLLAPAIGLDRVIMRPRHRMYIDEIGDASLGASIDPNARYLSLTGAIVSLDYVVSHVHPAIEQLKSQYFGAHPDDPIVLHRNELVGGRYPFGALRDDAVRMRFDADVLRILQDLDYVIITAVIDKLEHQRQYRVWQFDPYHYCLTVLVERYSMWLGQEGSIGDVMAESRGGRADRRLKDSFRRLYIEGSEQMSSADIGRYITSKELKVKPKTSNIAGLQLVELVAFPSYESLRAAQEKRAIRGPFNRLVSEILVGSKYRRGRNGKIDGYGRKWLP